LLDPWKYLNSIKPTFQIKLDESILKSTQLLLQNQSTFIASNAATMRAWFESVAAAGARCRTCPTGGGQTGIRYFDQIIGDLDWVLTNYGHLNTNIEGLIKEMAASGPKADGGAFMLFALRNRGSSFAQQVSKFEFRYLDGANFEADISLKDGTLQEFKSYAKSTWDDFPSAAALNQLKAYLKNGNFEYYANIAKLTRDGVPEAQAANFVKERFQKAFQKNDYALFSDFWGSNFYKTTIFNGLSESQARLLFKDLVDKMDTDFFKNYKAE
jgi:hypothetical protein